MPTATGAGVKVSDEEMRLSFSEGWRIDGRPGHWRAVALSGEVTVFGPGGGRVTLLDPLERGGTTAEGDGVARAPMPGRVVRMAVAAGDTVAEGDLLAVLEAMKMEHRLIATVSGTVAEVAFAEGDQVAQGSVLVRLEDGS